MGVSIEKASAWIATISSKTRESASVIGNSLKSIMSRYAQIKEKGFSEEDATNINQVTKALKAAGVVADDGSGQLRNFSDVIDDLMGRWDGLDDKTKRYVATTLGGTFQLNRFLTLMENSKDAIQNYETALNASGTAQNKYNIYMDSSQSAMEKVKASWEGLMQSFEASGAIKTGLNFLSNLIDSLKYLPVILPIVISAFFALGGTITTVTTAVKGLTIALAKNPIGLIAIAITTVIVAMAGFGTVTEDATEKLARLNQETSNLESNIKNLNSLYSSYEKLSSQTSLTTEESKKLIDIQNQIANIAPDLVEAYDSEGNAILKSKKALEEKIEKLKIEKQLKEESKRESYGQKADSAKQKVDSINAQISYQQKVNKGGTGVQVKDPEFERKSQEKLGKLRKELVLAQSEYDELAESVNKSVESFSDLDTKSQEIVSELIRQDDSVKLSSETMDEYVSSVDKMSKKVKNSGLDVLYKDYADVIQQYQKGNASINQVNAKYDALKNKLIELGVPLEKIPDYLDAITEKAKKSANSFQANEKGIEDFVKSVSEDMKTLNQAYHDVSNGEKLTGEQAQKLIEIAPELQDKIKETSDGWYIERDALDAVRQKYIENHKTSLEAQYGITDASREELAKRLKFYKIEIQAIQSLDSAISNSQQMMQNALTSGDSFAIQQATQMYEDASKYGKALDEINALEKTVLSKNYGLSKEDLSGSKSSQGSSQLNEPEKLLENDRYYQLNQALDLVNTALERNNALQQQAKGQDRVNLLKEEVKLLQDKKDRIHDLAEAERAERKESVGKLKNFGVEFSGKDDAITMDNYDEIEKSLREKVDSHRKDKDKTAYNQLYEQYKDFKNLSEAFFRVQKSIKKRGSDWWTEEANQAKNANEQAKISFEDVQNSVNQYDESLKNLDSQLKNLSDNDIAKKIELLGKKTEIAGQMSEFWANEAQRFKDFPEIYEKINELAEEYRRIVVETTDAVKELKVQAPQKAKELIDSYMKSISDKIKGEIDKKEYLKENDSYITERENEINLLEKQLELTKEQNDLLKEQEERQKRLLDIQKAQEELNNIKKEKNVRIYHAGVGFLWESDPKALRSKTEEIQKLQEDYSSWELENTKKHEEENTKKRIDALKQEIEDRKNAYDNDIKILNSYLDQLELSTQSSVDGQITSFDELQKRINQLGIEAPPELQKVIDIIKELNNANLGINIPVPATAIGGISTNTPSQSRTALEAEYKELKTIYENGVASQAEVDRFNSLKGQLFDDGGMLPHGGIAVNLSGKPEPILSPEQYKNFNNIVDYLPDIMGGINNIISSFRMPNIALAGSSSSNSNTTIINVDKVMTSDVKSFIEQMKRKVRSS